MKRTLKRLLITLTLLAVVGGLLAWAVLGESPNLAQLAGFTLALAGGLAVALLKESRASSGDREEVAPLAEPRRGSEPPDPVAGARQPDGT